MLRTGGAPLLALVLFLLGVSASKENVHCDIVVAGGSAASLAAAITAAEAAPSLKVCLTDPTDWPGGQLTAGGVPAIDFGPYNTYLENQPASFRDLFTHIPGNPGACWVSIKCYQPQWLMDTWITPRLARSPNLHVFLRTVITNTTRDTDGRVTSLTGVRRVPLDPANEYAQPLSAMLDDWYSPDDSSAFTKDHLTFTGSVFIETTEFGDVLATGGMGFAQGVEVPYENSTTTLSTCGQSWTFTYYIGLGEEPFNPPTPVPPGSDEGEPFPTSMSSSSWRSNWSYRRARAVGNTSTQAVNVGDISQMNNGNDLDTAYVFLPSDAAASQRPWRGGVNLTALQMLEGRAYGYFHSIVATAPNATWSKYLALNYTVSGTANGLSKFPYLRDSRRATGLDGFRLDYSAIYYYNASAPLFGYRFPDAVALANYNDDTHHLHTCTYPDYMSEHLTKPFWVPFRAITVDGAPNVLVAGKTMAQTFHASSATRLHPSEWTTGVAAGGTAVYMVQRNVTSTAEMYAHHIHPLRTFLNSSTIGQPLAWTLHGSPPPLQIGWACALPIGRCVGTDHKFTNETLYPTDDTCGATCAPLASNEWLAIPGDYVALNATTYKAFRDSVMTKSVANWQVLPPSEVLSAPVNTICNLVTSVQFLGFYLCTV